MNSIHVLPIYTFIIHCYFIQVVLNGAPSNNSISNLSHRKIYSFTTGHQMYMYQDQQNNNEIKNNVICDVIW